MVRIETSRLILRPPTPEDAEAVSCNSVQPSAANFLPDMVFPTPEDARRWIAWATGRMNTRGAPCGAGGGAGKADGAVIGLAGVAPKRELGDEIELFYLIADPFQHAGYATEAAKALLWWAFEAAGLDVLSALVQPGNIASRRVLDKLGFVHSDTRGLTYDGRECVFDYLRLYHLDSLPGPEWELQNLLMPEPMDAFFDSRADGYDAHMLSFGAAGYERLGQVLPETSAALRILDIGCGTGIELDSVWRAAPKAAVDCVDVSPAMLERLKARYTDRSAQINVLEASYTAWVYPEETYDLVLSSMTLHHLMPEEKLSVYSSVRKSLRPGGCYIESDFIVDAAMAAQYRRRYNDAVAPLPGKPAAGQYHLDIPCTLETQMKLLAEAGFRSVEVLDEDIGPRGSRAIIKAEK